jgi:hypothetical protein
MIGWLHCFWAYGKATYRGREHRTKEAAHLMVEEARRQGGKVQGPYMLFKGMPPVT